MPPKDPVRGGVTSERSWTFVISKMTVSADLNQHPIVLVEGRFIFITHAVKELDVTLDEFPLSPLEAPVTFHIPPWLFDKTPVDHISPKLIQVKMEEIFRLPFKLAPKAPFDIPLHKVVPSKRDKVQAAQLKARLKELIASSPEEDLE